MITIWYYYHKKNNIWRKACKKFNNAQSALRFMKAIDAPNRESFVDSYECDDPYDNEYLFRNHSLNGGKGKVWAQ